jgi:hypothetical protein
MGKPDRPAGKELEPPAAERRYIQRRLARD